MKIGDLAHRTGVSVRLLRYYEEQGLLTSVRAVSGHRRYAEDATEIVRRIRTLLAAGLSTNAIRGVLGCVSESRPELGQCVVPPLRSQLATIDNQIAGLQQTRSALTTLLDSVPQAAMPRD
jgi:DNA-binding transcriptional MerR regulator